MKNDRKLMSICASNFSLIKKVRAIHDINIHTFEDEE